MISKISNRISDEYCLRQLAEECCELAQTALKLVRAGNGETPLTELEAKKIFIEELADVELMLDIAWKKVLRPKERRKVVDVYNAKAERFLQRLEGAKE